MIVINGGIFDTIQWYLRVPRQPGWEPLVKMHLRSRKKIVTGLRVKDNLFVKVEKYFFDFPVQFCLLTENIKWVSLSIARGNAKQRMLV